MRPHSLAAITWSPISLMCVTPSLREFSPFLLLSTVHYRMTIRKSIAVDYVINICFFSLALSFKK